MSKTFDLGVEIHPSRGSYCAVWQDDGDGGGALIVVGYDPTNGINADGSHDRDPLCGEVKCGLEENDGSCHERLGRRISDGRRN